MKEQQPDDRIVRSLKNLKAELMIRQQDTTIREIIFKINSCLFAEYPIAHTDMKDDEEGENNEPVS